MRILPAIALALVLAGCEKATRPAVYAGPPLPPNFTSPESTLATLARAVHEKAISDFGMCFADTLLESREFHAVFDSADVALYLESHHSIPDDWRRDDELAFFPGFVNHVGPLYRVDLTVDPGRGGVVVVGGSSQREIWHVRYRVWSGEVPVVAGAAALTLERVGLAQDAFRLVFWSDARDTAGVRTWGMRRLEAWSADGTFQGGHG